MLKIANMQRNKSTIFWDTMPYSPFNWLHDVISHKAALFITTGVRT
jgi:hypothetical protein